MGKRKISRKEIKQPDEFISLSTRVIRWLQRNRRAAIRGGLGVVVLFALAVATLGYQSYRSQQANRLFNEAVSLLTGAANDSSRRAEARAKLEEVARSHSSSEAAVGALLELAQMALRDGDYAKAIEWYQAFLARIERPDALYDLGLEGLGLAYEGAQKWNEALEVYQDLAANGAPVYQTEAQYYLGRVYEAMGKKSEAASHYQTYLSKNPTAVLGEVLKAKLARWRQRGETAESAS